MNPFIGSEPDLINNRIIVELENQLNRHHAPIDLNIFKGVGSFYNNFIEPNMFPIIVITLLVLYLTIKYVIKRDNDEKNNDEKNIADLDSDADINANINDVEKIHHTISRKKNHQDNNHQDNNLSQHISDDYLLTESE